MAWSLPVTQGVTEILAAQYNYLRLDVLDPVDGHSHTGDADGGKRTQFSDLAYDDNSAPTGLNNTLAEIDGHIGTTAGTGGSLGVHNLHASSHPLGTNTAGKTTLNGFVAETSVGHAVSVSFSPYTFTAIPDIFIQPVKTSGQHSGALITVRSTTGFTAKLEGEATGLVGWSWQATGTPV